MPMSWERRDEPTTTWRPRAGESMKVIKVSIGEDGKVEMDYNGFVGNDCQVAHEKILKRLKDIGLDMDLSATESIPKPTEMIGERQKESL